jgi:hypothetical protein
MNALLESVGVILSTIDSQEDFIANHYNKSYNLKYNWLNRLAIVLKSKFCNLCHGPPNEGGSHTKHELKVKKLKRMIDNKVRIIINNVNSIYICCFLLSNSRFFLKSYQVFLILWISHSLLNWHCLQNYFKANKKSIRLSFIDKYSFFFFFPFNFTWDLWKS